MQIARTHARTAFFITTTILAAAAIAVAGRGPGGMSSPRPTKQPLLQADDLVSAYPGLGILRDVRDGRINRLYGRPFSTGDSPAASAAAFVDEWSTVLGANADDLELAGPSPAGNALQGVMYDAATDTYKFTAVHYRQVRDGLPVWGSRLTLLVRNEPGFPLVLAGSDLRDVNTFSGERRLLQTNATLALAVARNEMGSDATISDPTTVIFAGDEFAPVKPRVAMEFVAVVGGPWTPDTYDKRKFVIDSANGGVLHEENMILHFGEQTGNVQGLATEDSGAEQCHSEVATGMPYAEVLSGSNSTYADSDGSYTITLDGNTVTSYVRGLYFDVANQSGSDSVVSINVGGPSSGLLLHNENNNDENYRAEVNAYIHANVVRDFVLEYNPTFPAISNQYDWPVNVNHSSTCNAYYDYSSINFYRSGGGCSNTAFSVVVHHEYGHHLVASAGSGQGEYGEGMGDVMGVLLTGDPELARGFYQSDCNNGIRTADNNCQYSSSGCSSCGSAIHACGQLLSGIVWDIRQSLMATEPTQYNAVISNISINSILLHNGTAINDAIAIDFLTLDDNDGSIDNGTPHWSEITSGFNAHGIDTPELALLSITLPDGLPDFVSPDGGTTVAVRVEGLSGQHAAGTGKAWISTGGSYVPYDMAVVNSSDYLATIPASDCGTTVDMYFSAETTSGMTVTYPGGAPGNHFSVLSAAGDSEVTFDDNFQTDMGWSVSGTASGSSDGRWQRGVPAGGGDRGDPASDADGSGMCYLTGNADGNTDVDATSTILTSPTMDASGTKVLAYWRWYDNTYGASPYADTFVVEISDDNGSSWTNLETVGPSGGEVAGGWYYKEWSLSDIGGFEPNASFRIRFTASDLGEGSVIEAAVDGVQLFEISCEDSCAADVNGDSMVDVSDLLAVIAAWGGTSGSEDVNSDGAIDVSDLLAIIGVWGSCP
ncbi:MAG: hypothetical protein QGH76_08095 [Phycisphaerales bacterium]|nr:hypothetical protein [Phycisphaerales bacterium]